MEFSNRPSFLWLMLALSSLSCISLEAHSDFRAASRTQLGAASLTPFLKKSLWQQTQAKDQPTTGSPGVIGSEVTFVRFVSNMKPRYLGTSNHIIKVGIEAFSYGKWGSKWGVEQKNRHNSHFCSNFSLKSKMIFRIRNMRQETLCYTKIVQGIQIWGPIITSAIYDGIKLWKSDKKPTFFQ